MIYQMRSNYMKNYTAKQVCDQLIMARRMQSLRDPNFKEWHSTIYDDGIWKIDAELHPYGTIRFWVSEKISMEITTTQYLTPR